MFKRCAHALLALATSLGAQPALENTGKPMLVVYQCSAADTLAAGLGCSEEDPCQVYLELSNVDAAVSHIFVTGNIHTPMATLYSVLLASQDGGSTWNEPYPRMHSSGLDQIQFVGDQNGWISGANLQGAPRNPFLLITTDSGKTWREQPIFDEDRVAAIERFSFDSPTTGTLWIDARLDGGTHELYKTQNGGANWAMERTSDDASQLGAEKQKSATGWRLRTDALTHSYVVEKSESSHWRRVASFLVDIATCKE